MKTSPKPSITSFFVASGITSLLACICLSPWASAQDISTSGSTVEQEIRKAISTYEDAVRANTLKIINATTEEEKAKYRSSIPTAAPYATQVLQLVESAPEDLSAAAAGLSWLATQGLQFPEGQKAIELLTTRYHSLPGLAIALRQMEYQAPQMVEKLLLAVRTNSPHREEKAAATYVLGVHQFLQSESQIDPDLRDRARTAATDYFQSLIADYADIKIQGFPLEDLAGTKLFELNNIGVGLPAPEITGQDQEGKAMNLSDFRGSHVLLIFWGDWCHSCHHLAEQITQLQSQVSPEKLTILGINTDIPEKAKAKFASSPFPARCWLDGSTSGPITSEWSLRHFPTLHLIGPDGIMLQKNTHMAAVTQFLSNGP